jgi:chemotaxis family two-component system sensor kinase Cph1
LTPLNATGAALLFENQVLVTGDTPGTDEIRALGKWLESKLTDRIYATSSLATEAPGFAPLTGVAAGVVAARISGGAGEMLIWFRSERVRTVTWGGNPFKPPSLGDDPSELSPRRSFAQWHQIVEGTSDPWSVADLTAARLIGASVTDVIVQFQSVRILIVQDQLDQVVRLIRSSDQQVVVADADGKILQSNDAFVALLGERADPPGHLDELPAYFADPLQFAEKLRALRTSGQPWRAEVLLENASGEARPLLLRADPVMSSPDRVLGYVFLFTDFAERKAAEAARRQFQEGILQSHRMSSRMDSKSDLKYQTLMSSIVENAQLAALEITDGNDMTGMPTMLKSIRASVARAAEVLGRLRFDSDAAEKEPGARKRP